MSTQGNIVTPGGPATTRESNAGEAVVFAFIVGLIWLLEAIGWLYGGGLSALLRASHQLSYDAGSIDIDEASLRTPIMTCLALLSWGAIRVLHLELKGRWWGAALAIVIFGGGFVLDGVFEPSFESYVMASCGYERCPPRDHHVGNGKSRVWFANYVRTPEVCAARRPQLPLGAE